MIGSLEMGAQAACACGSGRVYRECCGLSGAIAAAAPPIPFAASALPLASSGYAGSQSTFEQSILDLLRRGNLPQADLLLRRQLAREGETAAALNCLGWVAAAAGLVAASCRLFARASALQPEWPLPRANLEALTPLLAEPKSAAGERYLLIKAWGFGFWSDVSHVLGNVLLAFLSGRRPVVHWGDNSLFADGSGGNAFESYFEPVSEARFDKLTEAGEIWPPKWNRHNLAVGEIQKWRGSFSRVAAMHLLARAEPVAVADFHVSVLELLPYIPAESPLRGLGIDDLYLQLARASLRPKAPLVAQVEAIRATQLRGSYLAVHVRGSDKVLENPALAALNAKYPEAIDAARLRFGLRRIFLMTDDAAIRDAYQDRYGSDLFCTDCQRTRTSEGVHYQSGRDRRRLGEEVLIDALIASQASAFIGNGSSNASAMVKYLKVWAPGTLQLLGPQMLHAPNSVLHLW